MSEAAESLTGGLGRFAAAARSYLRDLSKLFATELGEQARALRRAIALAAAGAFVLILSFILLSLALVGLVAYAIASWRWALWIVGGAYVLVGAGLLLPLVQVLRRGPMRFDHTRRRLREDAEWVKRKFAA